MRPSTSLLTRTGSLGGRQIAMTIDNHSIQHIMGVLTDLYSDKEAATIREVSANAWDAQRAVGVKRPIEVTSPNRFNPVFRVRDYGVGLDEDDMENVVSKYGASTKRDSNDQVGMLGLGFKAPLTYTDQFTIKAVKNGVLTHATLSKLETGAGVLEIVSIKATNAPNGTEISVPVSSVDSFVAKMNDFYQYWPQKDVLIDGRPPVPLTNAKVIDDQFMMIPGQGSDMIVMGNVAYPCDNEIGKNMHYRVIARVEIGEIDVVPSREAVQWTPNSRSTANRLSDTFRHKINGHAQKDIDAQPTKAKAYLAMRVWSDMLGRSTFNNPFTYRGASYPTYVQTTCREIDLGYGSRTSVGARPSIYLSNLFTGAKQKPVINVYSYTNSDISSTQRKKVVEWLRQNNITANHSTTVLVSDKKLDLDGWIDDIKYVSWMEIRKIQLTPSAPRRQVNRVNHRHFDVFTNKAGQFTEPDTTKPLFYYINDDYSMPDRKWLFDKVLPANAQVVSVPRRRFDSFNNKYGSAAKVLRGPVQDYLEKLVKNIPNDLAAWMKGQSKVPAQLSGLDHIKIDDPELAAAIAGSKSLYERAMKLNDELNNGRSIGSYVGLPPGYSLHSSTVVDNKFDKRYPLVSKLTWNFTTNEKLDYINAMYHYKIKGN